MSPGGLHPPAPGGTAIPPSGELWHLCAGAQKSHCSFCMLAVCLGVLVWGLGRPREQEPKASGDGGSGEGCYEAFPPPQSPASPCHPCPWPAPAPITGGVSQALSAVCSRGQGRSQEESVCSEGPDARLQPPT